MAVVLFNLTGIGFGINRDNIEKEYVAVRRQHFRTTKRAHGRRILFFIEHPSLNRIAADWLHDFLGDKEHTFIKLLAVTYEDVENLFEARAEAEQHVLEMLDHSRSQLEETRDILIERGIPEDHIQTSLMRSTRKSRSPDKVLAEIQAGIMTLSSWADNRSARLRNF